MELALDRTEMDDALRRQLKRSFFQTADHMRNKAEPDQGMLQFGIHLR